MSRRVARKAHAAANPPDKTTHKTLTVAPRRSYWTMLWITPKQPKRQKTAPRKIAVDSGGMLFQYSAVRAHGNVLSRGMLSLILGMTTLTFVHVVFSLIGIFSGFVVVFGLLTAKRLDAHESLPTVRSTWAALDPLATLLQDGSTVKQME